MSFQQKNVTVTLANFSVILIYFSFRVLEMLRMGEFTTENVFRLWWTVAIMAVGVTILATILTHILLLIIEAIRTQAEPEVDEIEDERYEMIDLRGIKVSNNVLGWGGLIAMLAFVFGQSGLVLFSLLIFFGLLSQIVGDIARLRLYRRGL